MSKKSKYKPIIIKELKNQSLNLENLYKKVTNKNKLLKGPNSFYEPLMKMLNENKIAVIGYDFNVHNVKEGDRIQTFMENGVVFEWVKTDQRDIIQLFYELESGELYLYSEAKTSLLDIFEKKYNEYESLKIEFYEQIKSKVISEPLKDWLKEEKKRLKKMISEYPRDPGYSSEISTLKDDIEMWQGILDKHPNAIMWKIEGLSNDEAIKLLDINIKLRGQSPYKYTTKEIAEIISSRMPWVDTDGTFNVEQFLEEKGIWKPRKLILEEKKSLFNKTLFFINSHENSNFMRNAFSWALSDEEDSFEWFELIIEQTYDSLDKLKNKFTEDENPIKTLSEAIVAMNRMEKSKEDERKVKRMLSSWGVEMI